MVFITFESEPKFSRCTSANRGPHLMAEVAPLLPSIYPHTTSLVLSRENNYLFTTKKPENLPIPLSPWGNCRYVWVRMRSVEHGSREHRHQTWPPVGTPGTTFSPPGNCRTSPHHGRLGLELDRSLQRGQYLPTQKFTPKLSLNILEICESYIFQVNIINIKDILEK